MGHRVADWGGCDRYAKPAETALPSLIKFLVFCAVLAGLAYAGMFALATMVEPDTREMRVTIPSNVINRDR